MPLARYICAQCHVSTCGGGSLCSPSRLVSSCADPDLPFDAARWAVEAQSSMSGSSWYAVKPPGLGIACRAEVARAVE